MRDEVVWDDVEHNDVMSLDMTDKVMGCQSFQGASTLADAVLRSVKGWKEKGNASTWRWTCFAVVLVLCGASREIVIASCSANFVVPNLAQQIPREQLNHTCLEFARSTVKQGLRGALRIPVAYYRSSSSSRAISNQQPDRFSSTSTTLRAAAIK